MPAHRQGGSTPREAASGDPEGDVPSSPDALPDACDAHTSRRIGRLSGRTWDAVVWVPYVRFYRLSQKAMYRLDDIADGAKLFEGVGIEFLAGLFLQRDHKIDSIDAVDLLVQLKELTGRKIAPETFKEVRTIRDVLDAILVS